MASVLWQAFYGKRFMASVLWHAFYGMRAGKILEKKWLIEKLFFVWGSS